MDDVTRAPRRTETERTRPISDGSARPGWSTREVPKLLAFLRDRGLPFLRGADDVALRTLALGARTLVRRAVAGPRRTKRAAPDDDADVGARSFVSLGPNDSVTLLSDNAAAFAAKCAAVRRASRSIDCALYYLADDATGATFSDLLVEAASRGVRVRVAVDAYASVEKQYGPFGYGDHDRGALTLLDRLREAGGETYILGPDSWSMHRKFLFVDGAELVIGGRNIADHYAEPGWRDLELYLRGPFAASFGTVIEGTFTAPTAAPPTVRGILAGVPGKEGAAFRRAAQELIDGARETVDIEHAYLLSHAWFETAVQAAVARGVRVRVFTNSGVSNDLPFMNWRLATSVRSLVRAGARVFRRNARSATVHTKLIVADRRRVLFGSTNLDYYSQNYCAELDIAIEDERLGAELVDLFEQGLSEPTTEAVNADALDRECSPWSVSRICDLVVHDLQ
jgi:cardiolipin synthase A/B